jgi:hypothetical protein
LTLLIRANGLRGFLMSWLIVGIRASSVKTRGYAQTRDRAG